MSSPRASSFPSRRTRCTTSAARSDKGSSSPARWTPAPCSTFSPGARSGRTRAAGRRPMQHSHEALDRPGGLSGGHLLSPLRHREFRVLWAGMAVSLLGDGIFLIAIAWESYTLWNAPAALSIVGIGMAVPTVLFLLAGGIVSDRHDRRLVMMCADGIRALAVAVLAVLVLAGSLRFWELVALVAIYGVGTAFFTPAFEAVVPDLLPVEDLPAANSLDQFVRPIALRLAGPFLGGALVAGGAGLAFGVDAASFGASFLAVAAIRPRVPARDETNASALVAVKEGLHFIRKRVWLWGTLGSAAI
ncbi:MAG: MFS transporter, partial [Actinobacteria bacterium]